MKHILIIFGLFILGNTLVTAQMIKVKTLNTTKTRDVSSTIKKVDSKNKIQSSSNKNGSIKPQKMMLDRKKVNAIQVEEK